MPRDNDDRQQKQPDYELMAAWANGEIYLPPVPIENEDG